MVPFIEAAVHIISVLAKRNFTVFLVFFSSLLVPSAVLSETAKSPFYPEWEIGKTWKVSVQYRDNWNENQWHTPVQWEYRVTGKDRIRDLSAIRIDAYAIDERFPLKATLWYHVETRSLIKIKQIKRIAGKTIESVLTFEPGNPVVSSRATVPCDTPVWNQPSGTRRRYSEETRFIDGLKASENIFQHVQLLTQKPADNIEKESQVLLVTVSDDKDSQLLLLKYEKGKPWPVYGENSNMKYRLKE